MASEALLIPRRAFGGILLHILEGTLFPILELVKPEEIFFRCRAGWVEGSAPDPRTKNEFSV